ncbi:unnamed protein product [Orchesella dallaii]|uniref:LanC-like protein 2 n=1 Tax=Orchesella dallaii TaxID=48710 RepID=A0ABP1Q2K2_9HEXA
MTQETDRNYSNPWYGKEGELDRLVKPEFRKEMKGAANGLLQKLAKGVKSQNSDSDYSIYTGSVGIYYMYWYLNKKTNRPIPQDRVQMLLATCKGSLRGKRFSFVCGDAGPLVMAIVTDSSLVDKKIKTICLKKLIDLKKLVLVRDPEIPNEVMYGRVGYLWSLLFLNSYAESDDLKVESTFISQVIASIIDSGLGRHKDRLYYEWHEKEYIGAAHGYIGILYVLLKAKAYWAPGQEALIRRTLEWLISKQRFPSGNFKSSVGSMDDRLIHWCHGSPGAILLLLEAATVFGSQEFVNVALECGEVTWARGLLKKGYGICHGVSGNAYGLMALYAHTQDELWLRRSNSFAEYCFHYGTKNVHEPDRPMSLFEGLAGVIYMLIDFAEAQPGAWPKFPAFHL